MSALALPRPSPGSIGGIDPGLSGAIAVIDTTRWALGIVDIPTVKEDDGDAQDVHRLVEILRSLALTDVFLEKMIAMRQQPSMNTTLKLGRWRGHFEGIAAAEGIRLTQVRAVDWKAKMGTTADKSVSLARARLLFPGARVLFARKKDDGRAEAALIALYGCLTRRLMPSRPITLLEPS